MTEVYGILPRTSLPQCSDDQLLIETQCQVIFFFSRPITDVTARKQQPDYSRILLYVLHNICLK